jgi:hypothetical protein
MKELLYFNPKEDERNYSNYFIEIMNRTLKNEACKGVLKGFVNKTIVLKRQQNRQQLNVNNFNLLNFNYIYQKDVVPAGIEPATQGFSVLRSTD